MDTRTDTDLVTSWLAGDHASFAAIYDRYADAIHSFALARTRNRADAADIVHDTFIKAAERLGQLRDPSRLRAWLYAIARNRVIDATRHPVRFTDIAEFAEPAADDRDVASVVAASEVSELVWVAAESLTPRDQEILGLHLRHGLDGADLADVVGLTPAHLYTAMNRLKERLAKAVGALLVARHGSKDCTTLATLLAGWDGTFSIDVRSQVTRHVESCDECTERRAKLVAAGNFSAGSLVFAIPAGERIRTSVLRDTAAGPIPASALARSNGWRADGFPHSAERAQRFAIWPLDDPRRRRRMLAVAACVLVMLLAGGAVMSQRGNDSVESTESTESTENAGGAVVDPAVDESANTAAANITGSTTPRRVDTPTSSTGATSTTPSPATTTSALPPGSAIPPTIAVAPPTAPPNAVGTVTTTINSITPPTRTDPPPPPTDPPPPPPAPPARPPSPPPPPPPPPPPGRIVVLTGAVDLGATLRSGAVRLRNDGGQAARWTASVDRGFGVSASEGTIQPGQETSIQITVDRMALAEGAHAATLTVASAGGGGTASITAAAERPPTIVSLARTPPVVRTSITCGTTLVSVVVNAADESGVESVAVLWSSDGLFGQRTALTPDATGEVFTGQVGSFSRTGTNTLTAEVVDTRGNAATQATTVTVRAC